MAGNSQVGFSYRRVKALTHRGIAFTAPYPPGCVDCHLFSQLLTGETDSMQQFVDVIEDLISDHWLKILTAIGFSLVGWFVAHWRASRSWQRREFFERINFSLSSISDGTLRIRTLSEKSCAEIFLNEYAIRRLSKLISQTTPEDPIVPIPKEDSWYFLNAVLNELSEQFATGLIAREAGKNVVSAQYLICLTNECDGDIRTRKLRAMVVRRDLLMNLPEEAPAFESPNHAIRWKTLKQLSLRHTKEPWRFLELELVA